MEHEHEEEVGGHDAGDAERGEHVRVVPHEKPNCQTDTETETERHGETQTRTHGHTDTRT
eukprot:2889532-Rhodomonas_salina.1